MVGAEAFAAERVDVRAPSRVSRGRWLAGAALISATSAAGCSAGDPSTKPEASASVSETTKHTAEGKVLPDAVPSLPRLERLPAEWGRVPFAQTAFPRDMPSLVSSPSVLEQPRPAVLVYHPLERASDPVGWGGEELLFLGRDGQWRNLNMADLGLNPAWWPGADTYGAGELSGDGRFWAAQTDAGVVILDLTTGVVRHVSFPAGHPFVRNVEWVPGRNVVTAYARNANGKRYLTFHIRPRGRATPVSYDGSKTRFDVDGTRVVILRTARREFTVTRMEPGEATSSRWMLPADFPPGAQRGVFSETRVALSKNVGDGFDRQEIWVFDKATGDPLARLAVPMTEIVGWLDDSNLLLNVDGRRLVTWEPETRSIRRVAELPGPFRQPGEWAAATVTVSTP